MSCTPQQEVRDSTYSLGDLFKIIIVEVTEELETVETGDIEIEDKTPPTIVDYIITWGDIHGKEAVSVVANPNIGGLFIDETINDKEKWMLIHFVGTDPDHTTNVWI